MELKGIDEVLKKLNQLSNVAALKSSRSALLSASNVVKNAAVEKAKAIDDPETAEDISKNIVVRFSGKSFRNTGDVKYRIGVAGGAKQDGKGGGKGGDTFYWRFLEFGTKHMPAQPFMRPAIDENKEKAVDTFTKIMKRRVDKAVGK